MADLTLYIKGDSQHALIHLREVKKELAQVAKLARLVNDLYGKKGVPAAGGLAGGGAGKSAVAQVGEDADKAQQKVKKLFDETRNLFKGFRYSTNMPGGGFYTSEAFLKDIKQKMHAAAKATVHGEGGFDPEILRKTERVIQTASVLTRQYDLDINKRIREGAKRAAEQQSKLTAQLGGQFSPVHFGGYAFGNEYESVKRIDNEARGYKNLERDARAAVSEINRHNRANQTLLKGVNEIEKSFTKLSNTEKGTVLIRRRGGEETRRSIVGMKALNGEAEKLLKKQAAFGDSYMRSVGKAAQRYGIFVDPKKARGGMQVLTGNDSQWMKHERGVYVKTAEDAKRLRGEVEKLGYVVAERQGALRGFAAEVGSMMRTQARWFAGAGLIFGGMAAVGTAVKSTMEFYQNLKNIQAITGESEEGIKAVGQAALDVAKNTPIAAGEASKFALKLVQAGLEGKDAAIAMRTVAELVTVTGEDSNEVSKAVTTAMFAWKKEAKDIPDIGQKIAATLNFSRLTIEDVAVAFNYLASTSSLMGKSLEETTAIMAVLNNMGIRASTIGTGISQLFTELAVPGKKFRAELEKMDIKLSKINPTTNKFADIVDRLREKGFSASKAYDLLQIRAGRQLAAALVATGDAFRVMEDRIARSTQLTEGLAKAKEGPIAKLKIMRNQLEVAAIQIGSVSIPAIDALTSSMTILTTIIQQVATGVSTLVQGFDALSAGLGGKVVGSSIVVGGVLLGFVKIFMKYGKAAEGAAVATTLFGRALWALVGFAKANPVIAILSVVAAGLAIIGTVADKSTKDLKEAFDENKKRSDHAAKESGLLNSRMQLEEQAVSALKDEWSRLGQAGERVGVLLEVRGLIDGFHLISSAVRDVNLEMEILEEKIANLKQSSIEGMVGGLIGAITKGGDPSKKAVEDRRNEIFNEIQKLGKEEERKAKLFAEQFAKADELLSKKVNVKDILGASISGAELTEMEKLLKLTEGLQQEWDGNKKKIEEAKKNLQEFQKTYREATATEEDKKKYKQLDADYQATLTSAGAIEAKIKEMSNMAGGEIKKRITDAAEKAKNALETVRDEFRKFRFDVSQIGRDDPFAEIFMSGQEEAGRLSRRIREIDREMGEVEAERKKAIGPLYAKLTEHLNALAGQKKILEEQKGLVPGRTKSELAVRANEVILAQVKEQAELQKEMGRLLPMGAHEVEATIEKKKLETARELLNIQKQIAAGDEDRLAALALYEKQLAGQEAIHGLREQLNLVQAINDEINRKLGLMDAVEKFYGANMQGERERLQFEQEVEEIRRRHGEDAFPKELEDKWRRMLYIGAEGRTLSEDFAGMWDGFVLGIRQAQAEIPPFWQQLRNLGKDVFGGLQRSSSDFFFNLSTAQGFDPEKHNSFWRYFQDVVDDFLKSVYQSFMRTLADIWSQWLTSGIVDMLGGVLNGKDAMNRVDQQAIATNTSLTGILMGQVGAVNGLTAAYWGLAMAKRAAGMGGAFGAGGSGGSFMGGNFATSLDAVPHTGGLILHNGGFVPRYHRGGRVLPSERLALLEVGEFVVNRRSAARNKEALMAMNNGHDSKRGGDTYIINNIQANDPKSFADYLRKHGKGAVVGIVGNDMRMAGSMRQSIRQYT